MSLNGKSWPHTWSGMADSAVVLINGAQPLPRLAPGVEHRIRILNITVADVIVMELRDAGGLVRWRPVAKDGADLPASQATARPARLQLGAVEARE